MPGPNTTGPAQQDTPILSIFNRHSDVVRVWNHPHQDSRYLTYYENRFGEQWVFEYDFDKEEGFLWGGDMGWVEERVEEGKCPGTALDEMEAMWLFTCWSTAVSHLEHRRRRRRAESSAARDSSAQ